MLTKSEIKHIQSLQDKKHRDAAGRFIAEGTKWMEELIAWQPGWIEKVYALPSWAREHGHRLKAGQVQPAQDFELKKISALATPGPVVAVVRKPIYELRPFHEDQWNLVLDGIQDPGNLGSIIRIADWFGLTAIWCSSDTVEAFNPKVVQSSMGSLCRVQIYYTSLESMLASTSMPICVTDMAGSNIFETRAHKGVVVIGSEGKGVRPEIAALASHILAIPRIGHAESLNAAVATGIIVAKLTSAKEKAKGH